MEVKPKKRKKKTSSVFLVIITIILIISALSFYFLSQSDYFLVNYIKVKDIKHLSEKEVLELANIERGVSIFHQDLKTSSEEIIQHSFVKDVDVFRKLPDTVIIEVTERMPLAIVVSSSGEFFKIDKENVYLEKIEKISESELPMITGIDVSNDVNPGEHISDEKVSTGIETVRLLWNQYNAQKYFNEIRIRDEKNILLYTFEGIEIRFGNIDNIGRKFELFRNVYEIKEEEELGTIEYIDVSYDKLPIIKHKE